MPAQAVDITRIENGRLGKSGVDPSLFFSSFYYWIEFIMFKKFALSLSLVLFSTATAMAQAPTASQTFRVVVPTNISITAPELAEITHDQSDADQSFPAQQWVVKGNVNGGVNVTFVALTPFIHTVDDTFKRDARLSLAVASSVGPASWTVTEPTDETNYIAGEDTASVAATSNGVGRANFDLSVQFITDDFGTFAAGNYESTVVGTVSAL